MTTRIVSLAITVSIILLISTVNAHAHKGSPWHGTPTAAALGLNTVYLEPVAEGVPTTFTVQYPVQENVKALMVGYELVAMVFPDSALDDGFFEADEVEAIQEGEVYKPSTPLTLVFTVDTAGYYHVVFGPGTSTSILVLQPPTNGTISVVGDEGGTVTFVVPDTAGDVHIIEDPQLGFGSFVAWIGVMFSQARSDYESLGIASNALPPLDSTRALSLIQKLVKFGYIDQTAVPNPYPPGQVYAPFLANLNRMGTLAFMTAYLTPGTYSFSYSPAASGLVVYETSSVVLQVTSDTAYDNGFGTETEILARAEYAAAGPTPTLVFEVSTAGYYHLMYGPGDGGFILHLDPDDLLPVSLVPMGPGQITYARKLGGINTVLWELPSPIESRRQVYFPCKLVDEAEFASLGIMSNLTVPLDVSVAQEVELLGKKLLGSVGGFATFLEVAGTPLETPDSSGSSAALLAGIAALVLAATIALGGAVWYARHRWVSRLT